MPLISRRNGAARRTPRAKRAADFDLAVAEFFMRLALDEAEHGLGRTSPEPCAGALLVKSGRILSRGHRRGPSATHPERLALDGAGIRARGADLYLTFEPCPRCAKLIAGAGIRRVFLAAADPRQQGRAVRLLRQAKVHVQERVLAAAAERQNRGFLQVARTGLPYVTLKAAITLDGKLATATGDSRWVTGEEARLHVHRLRNRVDAILVGANTVRHDDPQLTTRLPPGERGRDPIRVVVDSKLSVPLSRQVFQPGGPRTIVATTASLSAPRARTLARRGIEVWQIGTRRGRLDLAALLRRLAKAGVAHLLVEGGAQVFGTLLRDRLADELWLFVAPKLIGAEGLSWAGPLGIRQMGKALATSELEVERHGRDVLLRATLLQRENRRSGL